VIAAMNTGRGPDLLGVCQVENRFVVDRFVERVNATLPAPRSYAVVQADTDDARGIDVVFIYDNTLFQVPLLLEGSVFWPIAGAPDGSFCFDNQPNPLDQFLANKHRHRRPSHQCEPRHGADLQTAGYGQSSIYKERIPFGGIGKPPANQNGFSDHFPITMIVTEVD
jgi:Endonuclease/Exonuclease/phosphatase family